MPQFDDRVDTYIAKAAPFAQPILTHIRTLAHQASPLINETIKWGFPHFVHKGTICSMASFKAHCTFGFWRSALMPDPYQLFNEKESAMGSVGRITSLKDLPEDKIMIEYILEALKIDEAELKVKKAAPTPKAAIAMPEDFEQALAQNPKAKQYFEGFSPSHRREYLEWITEAKTAPTRSKRIDTALEWLNEGKARNWKYQK